MLYDILCSEECQTKKLLVCCKMVAFYDYKYLVSLPDEVNIYAMKYLRHEEQFIRTLLFKFYYGTKTLINTCVCNTL